MSTRRMRLRTEPREGLFATQARKKNGSFRTKVRGYKLPKKDSISASLSS